MNINIHADLLIAQKNVYEPLGFIYKNLVIDKESQEYSACTFEMNGKIIKFRVAKITPTKIGQFVTFWKRIVSGTIFPFDSSDQFDMLVISVRNGNHLGQFVFPKSILLKHNVISKNDDGGKRALRVYPPWDLPSSQQATRTQAWQLAYFFEIQPNIAKFDRIKWLFL